VVGRGSIRKEDDGCSGGGEVGDGEQVGGAEKRLDDETGGGERQMKLEMTVDERSAAFPGGEPLVGGWTGPEDETGVETVSDMRFTRPDDVVDESDA
jgi:hypothetical protein